MPDKATLPSPIECDGSGSMEICETKVPHKHCECGLPISRAAKECKLCVLEASGIRIHNSEGLIRATLERINHDAPEEASRSPFKAPNSVYQWGDMNSQRVTSEKSRGKDWLQRKSK